MPHDATWLYNSSVDSVSSQFSETESVILEIFYILNIVYTLEWLQSKYLAHPDDEEKKKEKEN